MNIAIQGHESRGKEVIQILKNLGGKNTEGLTGMYSTFYYINDENEITDEHAKNFPSTYKLYTLEEFETQFPFKIGDEVIFPVKIGWASGKVTGLTYREDKLKYEVDIRTSGYYYVESHKLQLYPMKEGRNITLTLDKAKEWYKKGGELKEVALQAFTEKELTKVELPKTWEEFCDNYLVKREFFINSYSDICGESGKDRDSKVDRNVCPSKESAEAHLAMIQLEQLRNCWWNDWEPDWSNGKQIKYCVIYYKGEFKIHILYDTRRFLSFPTKEMAEEFLKCFRDLIEKAGDLI